MIDLIRARLQQGYRTMAYPDGPPPALPERFRGRPTIDASKCPDGCARCAEACPTRAIDLSDGPRIDLGRCLFCTDCVSACPEGALRLQRRSSAGGPSARGPDRCVGSRARAGGGPARAAAPALRPLPQAATGERRRLQRLRARRERAEHRGLGPEPLRDPVRRFAPPRRRPADHRRDLREHAAGAAQDLRRGSGAEDRDRGRRLRHLGRPLPAITRRWRTGSRAGFRSTSTSPAVLPILSPSSTGCCVCSAASKAGERASAEGDARPLRPGRTGRACKPGAPRLRCARPPHPGRGKSCALDRPISRLSVPAIRWRRRGEAWRRVSTSGAR